MCTRYSVTSCTGTHDGTRAAQIEKGFGKWHSVSFVLALAVTSVVAWEAADGRFALRTRKPSVCPACDIATCNCTAVASMHDDQLR